MDIEFIPSAPEPEPPAYPGLYRSRHMEGVVLATNEKSGTVVKEAPGFPVGLCHDNWASFSNRANWERVTGTVTFKF